MTRMRFFGDVHQDRPYSPRPAAATLLAGIALLCAAAQTPPVEAKAGNDTPTPQQMLFWEAKKALERGDNERFGRYASRLRDDPLYPYLLYWRLERRMSQELPLSIEAFLQRYADLPLAPLLRNRWLRYLAGQGRWEDYLAFYVESDDAELRCHYHNAQRRTGNVEAAWEGARTMWLVGESQHAACDPLFAAWKRADGISRELRWQRIELAMERRNTDFADLLARKLPAAERNLLQLWQRAYDSPRLLLQSKTLREESKKNRMVIFHTLLYRAERAPIGTSAQWAELEGRYAFTAQQRTAIERTIAIGFAYARNERALEWFARLPIEQRDVEVCNLAVRVALRHQRWGSALAWLEVMPQAERRSSMARYWRGRIFEAMGFDATARHFFLAVSKERDYYGFLAADKLGLPYNLDNAPLAVSEAVLEQTANLPGVVRARELYRLGLKSTARREWNHAVSTMSHEQMLAAGKLAEEMGWQDRALLTLAKADHFDDLNIRFPLSYNEAVSREAKRRSLDPSWVYAVVRQESAMMPFVQSPVGALGLMQLMPQTGRAIARQLQLERPDRRQLLRPETNIRFGSYYLRQVLQQFNQNPVLATAAYNAGPHRIEKWYPKSGTMDADIWVDTIPFSETREYVRMVMAYSVFYDQRLQQPIKRLSERMPPVGRRQNLSDCGDCGRANAVLALAD